ncbi:TPA: VWA domain-containing protein [Raoultella planticola]|nr:VWA domain-containing protein [Raoultella planticola]
MSHFHFLFPWRLLGLIVALALWFFPLSGTSAWSAIMEKTFSRVLIINHPERIKQALPWLFAIGFIALSGPTWQRETPASLMPESNVMVIMQQDMAMYAQDLTPGRQERMQDKITRLMSGSPGTRYGLIVYSHEAFLTSPLSQDPQFFSLFLHAQEPSLMPAGTGSGLRKAVKLALSNLPESPRNVILVADTLTDDDVSFLKTSDIPLQVWVPGTAAGGPLPEKYASNNIDTHLPVDKFLQLRDAGFPVTLVTSDDNDLSIVQSHINQSITQQSNANSDLQWKNSGWLMVIPMLVLLFFCRRQIICIFLPLPLLIAPPSVHAAWLDAWIRPDVQGQFAFRHGDYQSAARHFQDPVWLGISLYKSGNYPAATVVFRRAPQTPETLLWTGNSLAQQKKWELALKSYDQALSLRPDWSIALQNREKISKIVVALRRKERDREQDQGEDNDMEDKPDKILHDLKKNQGVTKKEQNASANALPELNQWYDHLQISPSGLLENIYRNESAQEPEVTP